MLRLSAAALIAVIVLGCGTHGDSFPPRAAAQAQSAEALRDGAGTTEGERVPLTLSLTITPAGVAAHRFTASGDGECRHYSHPADHAGVEWEVLYRGESGPGIRMLVLKTSAVVDGVSDDIDMQLDAGDTMHLIQGGTGSRARAGAERHPSKARVSVSALGAGVRLAVDGVFRDGARIGGTIGCARLSSES